MNRKGSGASAVFLCKNPSGRGVTSIDMMYIAALELDGSLSVVMGWTMCRVQLLEPHSLAAAKKSAASAKAVATKAAKEVVKKVDE